MPDIKGYRDLSTAEIAEVNKLKDWENRLAELCNDMLSDLGPGRTDSHRQIAMAKTDFENGFFHLIKSVTKPVSPWPLEG